MQKVDSDEIRYDLLPEQYRQIVRDYIQHGLYPGSGWTAILEGNLRAVVMVDDDTFANIREIWRWLYNRAPQDCWGSPQRVSVWIKARQAERRAA